MFRGTAWAAPFALLWCATSAQSQTVLTVERVLELAERQNPEVLIAKARIAQAAGGLTTARARFAANPDADFFLGSRDTLPGGRLAEVEFNLMQRFELGGQRGYRVAAANAAIDQRRFEASGAALSAQLLALDALYRAVHASEMRQISDAEITVAEEAVRAAQARFDAGETALLDVNVARVELARARRAQLAVTFRFEGILGELREILALPAQEPVELQASLDIGDMPVVRILATRLAERPDMKGMGAAMAEAEAELRLARAARKPDLSGGFGFVREEGEPVIGGRFGMTLPLFQRQTGAIAAATGRVIEVKTTLEAKRIALDARLQAAYRRYTIAVEAAEGLTAILSPLVEENEQLTRDSYQAGKIGLLELLVIRREGFAARREALDAQLEATLAALDVRSIAGVIR